MLKKGPQEHMYIDQYGISLPPTPATSADMKTLDPHLPGHSASLTNWSGWRKQRKGPWCPWTSSCRRQPKNYSSGLLCCPNIQAVIKKLLYELGLVYVPFSNPQYLIMQQPSSPMVAGWKEFYCTAFVVIHEAFNISIMNSMIMAQMS
jgi:hypothetical protein